MRNTRLIKFRCDDPYVIGQGAGDLRAYIEPVGVNAVVVRDQDAHQPRLGTGRGSNVSRTIMATMRGTSRVGLR